ncbi:MAG: alpha/beta hydrolase [Pseudomonadota bacterium]
MNPPRGADLDSLQTLSIEHLRQRTYGSLIQVVESRDIELGRSFVAAYHSDGLRVYTRIDVPVTPPPPEGYPVVVFAHGWRGIDAAPSLDFYYASDTYYYATINAFRDAGFVVFVPGYRGHGTVAGELAEGLDYLAAWDTGTYLTPVFYAIDLLNLLDGLASVEVASLNLKRVNMVGHSQGGDATLFALAIAGEGSAVSQTVHAASIWAGTIAPRFTQLVSIAPMQQSAQAFLSGDGTWTGTAFGSDGEQNADFIFAWPSDEIESLDAQQWTWQHEQYGDRTVHDVLVAKTTVMYQALNRHVHDRHTDYAFSVEHGDAMKTRIVHDPRVINAYDRIEVFDRAEWLTEPLNLHFSDRDFYSPPDWNNALCQRLAQAGNRCEGFEYPYNTHILGVSPHSFFSPAGSREGHQQAVERDVALFR